MIFRNWLRYHYGFGNAMLALFSNNDRTKKYLISPYDAERNPKQPISRY